MKPTTVAATVTNHVANPLAVGEQFVCPKSVVVA